MLNSSFVRSRTRRILRMALQDRQLVAPHAVKHGGRALPRALINPLAMSLALNSLTALLLQHIQASPPHPKPP